jgi:NAD(P)-dependent dehydrogenase (short-subunit alcohol dehydrogenase family)
MQRTWFITGTSTGFGRALTEQLLALGERVAATARSPEALAVLQDQYPHTLWIGRLDVCDGAAIDAVVARAVEELGRIDVVVSNAGYGLIGAAEESTDEQIRRQIDTNLLGSIRLIRAFLPHLRRQHGGRIIQLSSMGGQAAFASASVYHATKWGIEGFVESVAQEVAPFGIEFTLVEPGTAGTDFFGGIDHTTPMPEYAPTPVGALRQAFASGQVPAVIGTGQVAAAIIASADLAPAPRRLPLGGQAYEAMHASLAGRLAALEARHEQAYAVDAHRD